MRDLLTHRSGLARGDLVWYGSGFDRDEIVRRVRFLQPTWSFRSQFGYQNIMYIAAGQVVAHVGSTTWDDFVQGADLHAARHDGQHDDRVRLLPASPTVATPHYDRGRHGEADIAAWREHRQRGPGRARSTRTRSTWRSGCASSSAKARSSGKRLLSGRMIDEMHTAQTVIRIDSARARSTRTRTSQAYGMGWFVQDYRGRLVVQHGGNVDGMTSLVAMMPEENFGIVFLTNMNGTGLPTALMNRIFDLQLKAPARGLERRHRARTEQQMARAQAAQKRAGAAAGPNTKPSLPLAGYAGTYADSLYGELTVRDAGDKLQLRSARTGRATSSTGTSTPSARASTRRCSGRSC